MRADSASNSAAQTSARVAHLVGRTRYYGTRHGGILGDSGRYRRSMVARHYAFT